MLTVGDLLEVKVVDVDFQGQGIIKEDGYVIFVKGLLQDEVAKIKITSIKKNYGQGKIVDIIKRSEHRVSNPQSILGSCDLLHMTLSEQIKWQEKTTRETFLKIFKKEVELRPTITDGKDTYYRNKSVFHVMDRPYLTLGLYLQDQRKLVEVSDFLLADHKTNEILKHLNDHKIIIDPKVFKHLVVRTNQKQEALVTIVSARKQFIGLSDLVDHLKKLKNIVGITLNLNTDDNQILGNTSYTLFGENLLIEPLNHIEVMVNDRSFFQINLPVAKQVYDIIKSKIDQNQTIIDAYSGVGSIGFYLAENAKKIILVESNQQSIDMANLTKDKYNLKHVDIMLGQAETLVKDLEADVLIVDPPRNGLMPEMVLALTQMNIKKIFYLSCDVKTLSRDLITLSGTYKIEEVYPIKMFYHTTSLETLVVLTHI